MGLGLGLGLGSGLGLGCQGAAWGGMGGREEAPGM